MTVRRERYAYCGAGRRHGEGTCRRPAGWGTEHVGRGRCKLHGGAVPIKHGRYSKMATERLGDRVARADPDPLDLLPELALLRAQADYLLEKHGPSLLVAELVVKVARMADQIRRSQRESMVSLATLNRLMEQAGAAIARHVRAPEVLAAIERDLLEVALLPSFAG